MRIEYPGCETAALRQLWKEAFGDEDAFLDCFFTFGYSPRRCRCVLEGETLAAALYWFECSAYGQKYAYIYGVATALSHRGLGLCRQLMADTHALLREEGFAGAVLVPQQEGLRRMYAAMGYRDCGGLDRFSCEAGTPVPCRAVGPEEFCRLRRQYLPEGAVLQEGENVPFLAQQAQFYAGDNFLLTAWQEKGKLHGLELLGSRQTAPGITAALGCDAGEFRAPGTQPFAMFLPLTPEAKAPAYFGFAFD